MMTLMIQARDQESEEDRAARRALDRGNHSMVKRFVCMMMAIEDGEGDQLVIHHHHPQVRMEESDQERDARRARNQARMAEVRMMMMVMMLVISTLMRIVMMTLMIQARDQESEEDKAARRALDRGNHSMVKRFVCKHTSHIILS